MTSYDQHRTYGGGGGAAAGVEKYAKIQVKAFVVAGTLLGVRAGYHKVDVVYRMYVLYTTILGILYCS